MNIQIKAQSGFTLVEIAVVLLVVTILLGYSVAMLPVQQELKQYRQAENEMKDIVDHLIAFAQVNGRLPCPDTSGDINGTTVLGIVDGQEDTDDLIMNSTGLAGTDLEVDNCKAFFGFLPSATLGMDGDINANGVRQDPWGVGYGYAVSEVDFSGDGVIDLISPKGIRNEGLSNIAPDLFVCDDSTALGNHIDCAATTGGSLVVGNVAVVITSLGKSNDLGAGSSNIQRENFDDFHNGTNDKVYISAARSDSYDDIVKWISPNLLFSKMIEADQLP